MTPEQQALHKQADSPSDSVRWAVAYNKTTHPDTLHKLSGDENKDVRYGVADNPSTHPDTLHKLATKHPELKEGIMNNLIKGE